MPPTQQHYVTVSVTPFPYTQSKRYSLAYTPANPPPPPPPVNHTASHLKSANGGTLEAKVRLKVLGNFTDQPLEGKLTDEKFSRLLVATNFSESDGTGPVTMRLFHSSGRGGTLAGGLRGQLFPRSFSSGRLSGGLLCTSHRLRL